MKQRIITGAMLTAAAILIIFFGGVWVGTAAMIAIILSMYEEYKALSAAGHRPVSWPTWVTAVIAVPLTYYLGIKALSILLVCTSILTLTIVIYRKEPKYEDAISSLLPLVSIVIPGLCIVSMAFVKPMEVQRIMLSLVVAVPVVGDTAAYFAGKRYGKKKLCPEVSPNKTVIGAVAGVLGSLCTSLIVALIAYFTCRDLLTVLLPHWWTYVFIGLFGGFSSQIGDLFASLVKRHCGIKDYSNLFPGHGGMLDRMDSILFMAIVVFCVCLTGNRF